jgi:DNA ligase 1
MQHPTLYHTGHDGSLRRWDIWTEGDMIITEHGHLGGATLRAEKRAEPKNIGRANETSPEEQAALEATSMWLRKRDGKYFEDIEQARSDKRKLGVMLAPCKEWKDGKRWVRYPADMQPKMDGNRCLAFRKDGGGEVQLFSRGRKFWNPEILKHLVEQLDDILPNDTMFDGELYKHGVPRQTINSWTKKFYRGQTDTIELHAYDVPMVEGDGDQPWIERREALDKFVPGTMMVGGSKSPHIIRVTRFEVKDESDVMRCHDAFAQAGFEGGMVRNLAGIYEPLVRSHNLIKVKMFLDAEFEIVGFEDGVGKNEGIVKWICKTPDGKDTFKVDQNASYAEKEQLFLNAKSYVGQKLTVKYQCLSVDGKPQCARGLGIRAPEDDPEAE